MKTISVIVPAFMEAKNIRAAVQNIVWALTEAEVDDYEILVIDCLRRDGTHDGTPEIAESLARQNVRVKVFHNSYINLGTKYWMGVDAAKFSYVTMIAGHNKLAKETLKDMLIHLGKVDIITSYFTNTELRSFTRRFISRAFTFLMNLSTGLNLHYYNHACIHKTDLVRSVEVKDRDYSFVYMAKLLTHLIKARYSYKEIPVKLGRREIGKSSAFSMYNFMAVGKLLFSLFWKYRIRGGR